MFRMEDRLLIDSLEAEIPVSKMEDRLLVSSLEAEIPMFRKEDSLLVDSLEAEIPMEYRLLLQLPALRQDSNVQNEVQVTNVVASLEAEIPNVQNGGHVTGCELDDLSISGQLLQGKG